MPSLRTYSVFICHDWEYSDQYYRICQFLDGARNFRWKNVSVPEHDPLDTNDALQKNLRDQIRPADVMLVLAGMYSARSGWMDWEMVFARRTGKAIIGVRPWGRTTAPGCRAEKCGCDCRLEYRHYSRCNTPLRAETIRREP